MGITSSGFHAKGSAIYCDATLPAMYSRVTHVKDWIVKNSDAFNWKCFDGKWGSLILEKKRFFQSAIFNVNDQCMVQCSAISHFTWAPPHFGSIVLVR